MNRSFFRKIHFQTGKNIVCSFIYCWFRLATPFYFIQKKKKKTEFKYGNSFSRGWCTFNDVVVRKGAHIQTLLMAKIEENICSWIIDNEWCSPFSSSSFFFVPIKQCKKSRKWQKAMAKCLTTHERYFPLFNAKCQ